MTYRLRTQSCKSGALDRTGQRDELRLCGCSVSQELLANKPAGTGDFRGSDLAERALPNGQIGEGDVPAANSLGRTERNFGTIAAVTSWEHLGGITLLSARQRLFLRLTSHDELPSCRPASQQGFMRSPATALADFLFRRRVSTI